MAYNKRNYSNSTETVTFEDFNRIETGIEVNDIAISDIKDENKEGSLAKKIADNAEKINANTEQIADNAEKIKTLNTNKIEQNSAGLTLLNAWVTNSTYEKPGVIRTGNIITIKGCIKNGVTAVGTVVATIDDEYRPIKNTYIEAITEANERFVATVNTYGEIIITGSEWSRDWTKLVGSYSLEG